MSNIICVVMTKPMSSLREPLKCLKCKRKSASGEFNASSYKFLIHKTRSHHMKQLVNNKSLNRYFMWRQIWIATIFSPENFPSPEIMATVELSSGVSCIFRFRKTVYIIC